MGDHSSKTFLTGPTNPSCSRSVILFVTEAWVQATQRIRARGIYFMNSPEVRKRWAVQLHLHRLDRLRRLGDAQLVLALVAREEAFEEADGIGRRHRVERLHVLISGEALAAVGAFEVAAAVGRRGVERARAEFARGEEGVVVFEFEERVRMS